MSSTLSVAIHYSRGPRKEAACAQLLNKPATLTRLRLAGAALRGSCADHWHLCTLRTHASFAKRVLLVIMHHGEHFPLCTAISLHTLSRYFPFSVNITRVNMCHSCVIQHFQCSMCIVSRTTYDVYSRLSGTLQMRCKINLETRY